MFRRQPNTESRRFVTDTNAHMTSTVAGANGMETILDLSPSAGIYYALFAASHSDIRGSPEGALRLRLHLTQDGNTTEIGDDAEVRLIAQGPTEEGSYQIGPTWSYRQFSQPDQFDNENVVRITELPDDEQQFIFTEDSHLKVQVDNSGNGNDVDMSESDAWAHIEMIRGQETQ